MPELDSPIHIRMFNQFQKGNDVRRRLRDAWRMLKGEKRLYGLEWGDPEAFEPLRFVRDRYVVPYVTPNSVTLEIGPGGGRWTRYLLPSKRLYVVDYHAELLAELRRNFNMPNMVFIKNNGADFPEVPAGCVDFLFSFGVFVHLELETISRYLESMRSVLKPGANVVLQYSDKNKIMAQMNPGFSHNSPETMRSLVVERGYRVLEEDVTTLWHSALIRFAI